MSMARLKADSAKLQREVDRLSRCLKASNDNHERFERAWYLRGHALEELLEWIEAHQVADVPEPDFARAHELLHADGISLYAIRVSALRYVITVFRKAVIAALEKTKDLP